MAHTVIVCGGRHFANERFVAEVLDDYHAEHGITMLVHGAASGADSLAERWAIASRISCCGYHAKWQQHGRAAGPMRNQEMLDTEKPDAVIAFPGGAGTADMVRRARKAGVRVLVFAPDHDHEGQPFI